MRDDGGTEWLTYAQAAQRFNVAESTIRSWVCRDILHAGDVKRWKGRVTGVSASAVARLEAHLWRHGPKLPPGVRRGATVTDRRSVQQ